MGLSEPGHTWDDLVVPEDVRTALRTIARLARSRARAASGRGSKRSSRPAPIGPFLFVGAAGTGKTLATQIIAHSARVPIRELDLGPGLAGQRTDLDERAVAAAFDAARGADAIVVIDGAAPLLGRPPPGDGAAADPRPGSDSVLSHLLDRAEGHDGAVILTSTGADGIDPELAVRFRVVVEFPVPEAAAREELWRRSLPADAMLSDGTLRYLASWLAWTGGTIHSCCLAAAEEAATEGVPTQLRHVTRVLDEGYRRSPRSRATRSAVPTATRSAAPNRSGPAVGSTPAHAARRGGGHRWPLIAGGGVISAAIIGLIVALSAGAAHGGAHDNPAQSGPVRILLPSNWHREAAVAGSSFGLTNELRVAAPPPRRGVLTIGRMAAGGPSQLPRSLLGVLPSGAAPEIVRLDRLVLYRYLAASRGDESIYAIPTTTGTIVAVCRAQRASSAFITDCGRVLATMKLTSGRAYPLTLSASYARALNAVITRLNAVRSSAGTKLATARTAHAQAVAAFTLARAHAQAASAVALLNGGHAAIADAALAHALRMTASAYRALALAASRGNRRAYASARTALSRTAQAQQAAFEQLRQLGYRLT